MSQINYLAVEALQTRIENVKRNFYNLQRVHLCIYNINQSGQSHLLNICYINIIQLIVVNIKIHFVFLLLNIKMNIMIIYIEKCNERMNK